MSDRGFHGLTLIAFIGSVFSPYYARARRRGNSDPQNHCAVNVALYGRRSKRWAMTERGRADLQRDPASLRIGPSALVWDGSALRVTLDEVSVPLPSRIRGEVRIYPESLADRSYGLDADGQHSWWPIAPCARVEVMLRRPALEWSGTGYFDSNAGAVPLEHSFSRWHWSRSNLPGGTAVLYDVTGHGPERRSLALRFGRSGTVEAFDPPQPVSLPSTLWRIARATRADYGQASKVLRTLEDTPFYARSVLSSRLLGEPVNAVHESLSLDRFQSTWVQLLLPFRMPRLAG